LVAVACGACGKEPPRAEPSRDVPIAPPAVASTTAPASDGLSEAEIAIVPASAASAASRSDVAKALGAAWPAALACLSGASGTVFVDVAFDAHGATSQVKLSAKNQLPVDSLFDVACFAAAFHDAHVPPVAGGAFTATFPVRHMPSADTLEKLAGDLASGKLAVPGRSAPQPAPVPSDYVAPKGDAVELTTTDITTLPDFRSDRASVLGVRLGMSMADAKAKIADHASAGFSVKPDGANSTRLYINAASASDSVLYLIWAPGDARLGEITVFRAFEPWLQGGTKRLLQSDAVDVSSVAGRFLGKPDRSGISLDIPEIGLRHVTHIYDARWIQLTEQEDGSTSPTKKVVFALASPEFRVGTKWTPLPR
jgi:hypothetical protein